jgi:hypothetical protein
VSSDIEPDLTPAELRQKLNLETGQLEWLELQRHFARGVVVVSEPGQDLVDVAATFAEDDKPKIERLLNTQSVHLATDVEAKLWAVSNPTFWAVVVAPWVIIQITNKV